MAELPEILQSGEVARLIPVIADSRKEQRAVSVFLATLSAVPLFSDALLGGIGKKPGRRANINTFTEVVLKTAGSTNDRPDGLIEMKSGTKNWVALVEAKISAAKLDKDQVQRYMQLAKAQNIDAVITISNQFVPRPQHSPITVPWQLAKSVLLFHWSWKHILTEALLIQQSKSIEDPDQAFILREFVRFISHDSVGITGFNKMPTVWRELVAKVKSGALPRRSSEEVAFVVDAWQQEMRDLALRMSHHLAVRVQISLNKTQISEKTAWTNNLRDELVDSNTLSAELNIPNAAAPIGICADVRAQVVKVGMQIKAPEDRKTSQARVNWLLRQIRNAPEKDIFVRIIWPSRQRDLVCSLADLRLDTKQILDSYKQVPRAFEVFYVADDARKFSGPNTLIEMIEHEVPYFYDNICQEIDPWVPSPPKSAAPILAAAEPESAANQAVDTRRKGSKKSDQTPGNQHSILLDIPPFLRRF